MNENERKRRLTDVVDLYIRAIATRDFSLIPYADDVTLRSPFTEQGVRHQLRGRDALYHEWWTSLVLDPPEREVDLDITDQRRGRGHRPDQPLRRP